MDDEDAAAREADDDDASARSVPLADLFLTLGAAFLFALFVAQPALQRTPAGRPDPVAALVSGEVTLAGASPLVLLAGADGVRVGGGAADPTPLERLRPDAPLLEVLREADTAGRPVLVAVEPNGEEAAFLLDPLLAGTLQRPVRQIRLDASCGFLRQAPLPGRNCLAALGGR